MALPSPNTTASTRSAAARRRRRLLRARLLSRAHGVLPQGALDLHQFFTVSRMVVVAGKGGVGKTTVSAAVACAAARRTAHGLVDLQANPALAAAFGRPAPFGHDPVLLWSADDGSGSLTARAIDPSVALTEYLDQHGLRRVSKRLVTTGVVDLVATAAPGIEDLLVLGKLKQMERLGDSDLIVVDGPPAGHAVQFLLAPARLRDAVSTGPIAAQADDVLEMLAEPERCEVILVTLPETTPVNELLETSAALRDRAGVRRHRHRQRCRRGPAGGDASGPVPSRRRRRRVPQPAPFATGGRAGPAGRARPRPARRAVAVLAAPAIGEAELDARRR